MSGAGVTVLVRGLQILAGLVTFYGTLGMFTTAGLAAPNTIVVAGLVLLAVASILQRSAGSSWTDGLWLYLGAVALPLVMVTLPTWSAPECARGAAAQTPDNYCISGGSHAGRGRERHRMRRRGGVRGPRASSALTADTRDWGFGVTGRACRPAV